MHLPGPLRAAVGLVAAAADEAKHLPDRAIELPMLAVSSALQASLRAQQRYASLAARGDQVLSRSTPPSEPPAWATFDQPLPADDLRRPPITADADTESALIDTADPAPSAEPVGAGKKVSPKKKAAAKKASTPKASTPKAGKTVSKPKHTAPSAFDNATDD